MSRDVPHTLLQIYFLCITIILNAGCANSFSDCSTLVRLDIDEIENYLSSLNLTDVPTVKIMAAGFKCPTYALPFGALRSDWSRLLLLREAQPDESIVKLKLVRLMRILIIAYFQMEERFDVTSSDDVRTPTEHLVGETMTTAADIANNSYSSNKDYFTTETSGSTLDQNLYTRSSLVTPSASTNDYPEMKITTKAEIAATKNSSNSSDVPPEENTISPAFRSCLKQSLKDIARRHPNRMVYRKVFENLKSKARHNERAANEIERNRTKILPPINEFWKFVTFPATSLGIFIIAQPTSQLKLFYDVDKNEENLKLGRFFRAFHSFKKLKLQFAKKTTKKRSNK